MEHEEFSNYFPFSGPHLWNKDQLAVQIEWVRSIDTALKSKHSASNTTQSRRAQHQCHWCAVTKTLKLGENANQKTERNVACTKLSFCCRGQPSKNLHIFAASTLFEVDTENVCRSSDRITTAFRTHWHLKMSEIISKVDGHFVIQ